MDDPRFSRVSILLRQKKYAAAENILKDLLQEDPNNVRFLGLLAEVSILQDKNDAARDLINHAIGLAPDESHLYYIRSRVGVQQSRYAEAIEDIERAIEMDPYDADYFAWLGQIRLIRKQFQAALDAANEALEIDAENLMALNTRSTALNKLNRPEESYATIEGALRNDPNNAYTHANYGWGLLERGDHKKALEHFGEALKNDPNSAHAQAGVLQAIKARNPIYRLFLRYAFWMGNMTARYQWAVILGFYVGTRALQTLAGNSEAMRPYLMPLIMALTIIAFSTWVITPISNLFLRFHKYGQLLLDSKEKMSANLVAASLLVFLAGTALYLVRREEPYLGLAVFGFAMMLPLSTMFRTTKTKNALVYYTVAMLVLGVAAVVQAFVTGTVESPAASFFLLGIFGFQWVANYFLIREDNR